MLNRDLFAKIQKNFQSRFALQFSFFNFAENFRINTSLCDNSSVGRASASQAEGHGFESRLSLSL